MSIPRVLGEQVAKGHLTADGVVEIAKELRQTNNAFNDQLFREVVLGDRRHAK